MAHRQRDMSGHNRTATVGPALFSLRTTASVELRRQKRVPVHYDIGGPSTNVGHAQSRIWRRRIADDTIRSSSNFALLRRPRSVDPDGVAAVSSAASAEHKRQKLTLCLRKSGRFDSAFLTISAPKSVGRLRTLSPFFSLTPTNKAPFLFLSSERKREKFVFHVRSAPI